MSPHIQVDEQMSLCGVAAGKVKKKKEKICEPNQDNKHDRHILYS